MMAGNVHEVDPSPLLAEEEGNCPPAGVQAGDHEDDVPHILLAKKEEEAQVPSSGKFLSDAKRKIWQFRYPLKVIGINLLSLVIVQALLNAGPYHMHYYDMHGSSGYQYLQYQTMLRTGLFISFLTFLWDANLCWQGAQTMEQKIKDQNNTGENEGSPVATATADPEYDYVQFSRRVDSTFDSANCHGTAKSSFIVCLLYALFSFALFQSVESGTSFLQVQFMKIDDIPEKGKCFESSIFSEGNSFYLYEEVERGIISLKQDPNFKSLPFDVRTWISQQGRFFMSLNQSLPFLQLEGGDFVFSKASNEQYSSSRTAAKNKRGVAVFSSSTKTVTEYSSTCSSAKHDWSDDGETELIAFPAEPPYSGWCSIFKTSSRNVLHDEVVCYNEKMSKLKRFKCVKDLDGEWNGWGSGQYSFFVTTDKLWIANHKHFSKGYGRNGRKSTDMASLNTYDIGTMEHQLVLNWVSTKQDNDNGGGGSSMTLNPHCSGYYWTIFAVSLMTLTLLSVFLYRLDVPSCTAPAALAVSLLMNVLTHPAAAGVYLLIMACACLYLLVAVRRSSIIWRYVSMSMLVWALYTLQIASSWGFWSPSFSDDDFYEAEIFFSFLPFPLLSFFVAAATNVLLNHPFFQILAACFGSLSLFSFVFALMGLNFLMVPVMCVVLSIGCFRTGTLLQMYRVHLIVHARRLYQKLPTCPSASVR